MRHSSIIERDIAIYTQRLALDSLVRNFLTKRKLKELEEELRLAKLDEDKKNGQALTRAVYKKLGYEKNDIQEELSPESTI